MTNPNSGTTPPPIGATALGYPRIGRSRELKRALEAHWAGRADAAALAATAAAVRADAWTAFTAAGLDSVPVNTFSLYDQVLDTSVLLGADPARYFELARGSADRPALEMTKWFDTNYHHLVPEIGVDEGFTLDATKPLAEVAEATAAGLQVRPVVVGPITYLSLAKPAATAPAGFDPLDRLDDVVAVYGDLLAALERAGVPWVQFDEPALVRDLSPAAVARVHEVYRRLAAAPQRPALLVATYFGNPVEALPALAATDIDGIAVDLTRGVTAAGVRGLSGLRTKTLVLGAVDGRNIWRTDLRATLRRLDEWRGIGRALAVSTSCSLLHVPYDVDAETELDDALRGTLAFADQKLAEVVALQRALDGDPGAAVEAFAASEAALARRGAVPGRTDPTVSARVAAVTRVDRQRAPRSERAAVQAQRLALPLLPTTTIGSFPQTAELRRARAEHVAGRSSWEAYAERMKAEIAQVVTLQEELGLDVVVHGEPERNDMVQYFAEQLTGFVATTQGWVQSYGSRCVRPPVLYGDVRRPDPMTVGWARYARGLTDRPVKGMLTGPVTILAWSFVRDDQPLAVTADQVALALRDEVADLEAAGVPIVQVDEPALRETLPLRGAEQEAYLEWAVGAFRLATAGAGVATAVHTHLCYSEFGEIVSAIDALDADVTSIEAARSRMELLDDVAGFAGALGPGVWDIHSPRVPSAEEVTQLLRSALARVPADRLWVNPDCGLKTRGYAEVRPALRNLVDAATAVRTELAR